jgi:hypothetical protein
MQPMGSEAGVPSGLNNAFTNGSTSRPIPSDMLRSYDAPNGLQGGGQMGGAERRPPLSGPPMPLAYAGAPAYVYPQPAVMPVAPPQLAAVPAPAVMQASATAVGSDLPAALRTLGESIMPSEREMAIDRLVRCDWKTQPEVVEALTRSARTDAAATVRAAAVRGLAKMGCNTAPVVAALVALKKDPDVRVRQDVEQALTVLLRPAR